MSPALNRRSVVRHFKCGDAIEIYDRIIVNSYTGLPHIHLVHVGVCVHVHAWYYYNRWGHLKRNIYTMECHWCGYDPNMPT